MSTIQRSRPAETAATAPAYRTFLSELLSFGFVGVVGTLIMIFGANLMRAWLGGSPVTSVAVPTVLSTFASYLLNRYWVFRHRDSDGSGREVAIFFALNGVGLLIQVLCTGFTYYTLGLHGGVAYNGGLLAGVAFGAAFRYWSYKKWVFTPAAA
ncbi:GtrA family protein [Actinomadura syzygii]|uniref:GtrA family protein n=1 Tax=Actinomadura syzygii TaxID=1427538 RepID=A0A5D0U0I5_9ACTN|nr:GtrA family protein [Actinomadura syzygii]TYC11577.1 GtrA family protein [Actinomadura syzygii]